MSGAGEFSRACVDCIRRARLLATFAGHIEHHRYDRQGLAALLALPTAELARALGAIQLKVERRDRGTGGGGAGRPLSGRGGDPSARAGPAGGAVVCRHHASFPARLGDLDGPLALHLGGEPERALSMLGSTCVAIVGARRATDYGRETARTLAGALASCGICVVSGMAMGVDSAAHEGALEAGGPTVAVLPSGVDVAYPACKRGLWRALLTRGAVVSELPRGMRPRRWCFLARNRLIAALASVTVVVEARERSGALVTAGYATDLGRDVGAVPGPVTSTLSRGPNSLIRDGAHLVRDAQDVLDLLYGVGVRSAARDPPGVPAHLAPLLDRVRSGLDTPGSLVAAGLSPDDALTGLAELELAGCVRRGLTGHYVPVV